MSADDVLRHRRRRHDPAGAAVGGQLAERHAQVVDPVGEQGRNRGGCGRIGREPDPERKLRRGPAHGLDDGQEQRRPRTPPVGPAVQLRREELREQVVVGGRDLDALDSALGCELGRARVPGDELVDLLLRGGARLHFEAAARHGGRRERRSAGRARDLLPAAVEELDEEAGAVRLDRSRDRPVAGDDRGEVAGEGVSGEEARLVDGGRLEHDQADSAPGAGLVVGDEVLRGEVFVDERRLVGGRDDPIRELDRADLQRCEQVAGERSGHGSHLLQSPRACRGGSLHPARRSTCRPRGDRGHRAETMSVLGY